MHQNLKTTYSLNLNNEWQTLVADYEYGTFYTIHCKFEFNKGTKSPKTCELYLQNFEGNVTLGLESINSNIEIIDDPLMGKPSYVMFIHVKALYSNNTLSKKPISINNVPSKYPEMKEFHKDYALKVELIFDKVNGFNENDMNNAKFIDGARFIRDGEGFIKNTMGERYGFDTNEVYENYSKKEYGIGLFKANLLKSDVANFGHTKESNVYDIIKLSDGKSVKMLKPYPCYLSYMRFI